MERILALIPRGDSRVHSIIKWTLFAAFAAALAAICISSDATSRFGVTVFTR
jgi:hypothetical protein